MKKGFTLIELLVVVLIIGVLAAIALPQYFKAVERSRMSEAEQLLTSIGQAQQRKYLQIGEFASEYTGLDVSPKGSLNQQAFCTKGTPNVKNTTATTCNNGNGFLIILSGNSTDLWGSGTDPEGYALPATKSVGYARAKRVNGDMTDKINYQYTLYRAYASNGTTCIGDNANGAALCADFCGIDSLGKDQACCNDGSAVKDTNKPCVIPFKVGAIN
jgi:prepilin-type N-terminal cleavage/methylation domain-containing protein